MSANATNVDSNKCEHQHVTNERDLMHGQTQGVAHSDSILKSCPKHIVYLLFQSQPLMLTLRFGCVVNSSFKFFCRHILNPPAVKCLIE